MTPEQALQIIRQLFVTKAGLSIDEVSLALQAWNVLADTVTSNKPIEEKKEAKE